MTAPVYPRARCRQLAPHHYEVQVQLAERQPWHKIGQVKRFGSLPSMRGWKARGDTEGAQWTRTRQLRGDAVADLATEHFGGTT